MNMYETVKSLCAARDMSIRELEYKMGFSYGSIAKWKDHTPAYEKVVKVANFFHVPPAVLRDDVVEEYPFKSEFSPVINELVAVAEACDPEDVKLVTEILRRLSNV